MTRILTPGILHLSDESKPMMFFGRSEFGSWIVCDLPSHVGWLGLIVWSQGERKRDTYPGLYAQYHEYTRMDVGRDYAECPNASGS